MKGYTEREVFKPWALRAYRMATRVVDAILADFEDDGETWLRCHEVARVVLGFLESGWEVIDGHYGSVQHSWLSREGVLLDVYAVARVPMVHLVGGHWSALGAYVLGPARADVRGDVIRKLIEEVSLGEVKRP